MPIYLLAFSCERTHLNEFYYLCNKYGHYEEAKSFYFRTHELSP